MEAFVGIDLAVAKGKRLPVAMCVWEAGRLMPLPIAEPGTPEPPRGAGNAAMLDAAEVERFAEQTATYLRALEARFGVTIQQIAIDAPSSPCPATLSRRKAEEALDAHRIHCFTTPSHEAFELIREKARRHIRSGGGAARLPHANQLWMLAGFALFRRLQRDWPCLEVFPQATASFLGSSAIHKSKPGGVAAQLSAVAQHTGWPTSYGKDVFRGKVHGPAHDGLDAYLAAWVAALPAASRRALGKAPDDTIWVPLLDAGPHLAIRPLRAEDYAAVNAVVDDWWGGRPMRAMLPRLFFEHFGSSSFAIDGPEGIEAFLIGFVSQSDPAVAYIHFIGVDPASRSGGIGRALYQRFFQTVRARGCRQVRCLTSPVNSGSIDFHRKMGFELLPGDGEVDGVAVHLHHSGEGQHRVCFRKWL